MSRNIIDHYEQVLGRHYSKLAGDFAQAAERQLGLLAELGVTPPQGPVLDLGAGAGLQAIPLSGAGSSVTAVDLSPTLLAELSERGQGLPISTVQADFLEFLHEPGPDYALAVCMGDTLLHLPSRDAVTSLFRMVLARLEPGAAFVTSFRDLSTARSGLDRFLTLVNQPGLRMRCFLEYFEDHVLVHDFIDELGPDGIWVESRGVYPKLRLSPAWVEDQLRAAGFVQLRAISVNGLYCVRGLRDAQPAPA